MQKDIEQEQRPEPVLTDESTVLQSSLFVTQGRRSATHIVLESKVARTSGVEVRGFCCPWRTNPRT